MKDRIPLYPGRVKLMPVPGQPDIYDMVRADQPTEVGTPINKATLLSDSTASLYGYSSDAVPNTLFSLLSKAVIQSASGQPLKSIKGSTVSVPLTNLPAIPYNKVTGIPQAFGSYTGKGLFGPNSPNFLEFNFNPKFVVVTGGNSSEGFADALILIKPCTVTPHLGILKPDYYSDVITVSWNGNTVSWYGTRENFQLNRSDGTYWYFAIG